MSAFSIASTALATPLSEERLVALGRVTEGLDAHGLWWLSGYAAGLASRTEAAAPAPTLAVESQAAGRLTIVYGSQTGNAKRVAERLARQAESADLAVRLLRADAYPARELKDERHLYLVVSTQGDGDPPEDARALVEFIASRRAPQLKQLRYAVLGLGDSSYPQFCAIGQKLDARLAELGATRLFARGDADLDIDSIATPWLEQALAKAKEALKPSAPLLARVTPLRPLPVTPAHHRDAPFAAEVLLNQRVTGRGSDKDVRHIELSLEGSGLHYEPGDALGLWPRNPPALVNELLDILALDGDTSVGHAGQTLPLREWLSDKRELTRLARPFLASHASRARSTELDALLASPQDELARFLARAQVLDVLRRYPAPWSADELVAALRLQVPRLYSIASSRKHVGDEAHLTVAHVEYAGDGGTRWGAASHLLASSAEGARLPIFVEHNERFRLPPDTMRDVIMIGPGTGVAPFRGFVQERAATRPMTAGAAGRNWLLFGNPHFRSDFLYQVEWQQALKDGHLTRLDLAFSRDQAHKVYVQDRLREHGRELFDWIEGGAHLYVCGDAQRMARDVHATLLAIIAEHGDRSDEEARDYLDSLQQQGRYSRDVY